MLGQLNAGVELHRAGRLSEAVAVYQRVLSAEPNNADALHLLGVMARQVGRKEDALELIHQAIQLAPGEATFWNSLGTTLTDLGRQAQALASFDRAVALSPALAEGHYNRGSLLLAFGRPDDAIVALERVIALRPEYADAHLNLGSVLLSAGHVERAAAAFARVLALQPGSPQALNNMGTVCRRQGDAQAALEWYQRAIDAQPDFAEPHYNRGSLLIDLGRADEAVLVLERSLTLRPDHLDAQLNLGNAFVAAGDLNRATAAFEGVLASEPTHARAELNLANALRLLGDEERALSQLRHIVEQFPEYSEAHNNLGGLLLARDDVDTALTHFRRAIELRPGSPDPYANLGLALGTRLELTEAMLAFDSALALDPEHPHTRWCRAASLLLQGDFERGWQEYEWRWSSGQMGAPRAWSTPRWNGEVLPGQRLLIWAEQGLGDTLQFARYARLLARAGADVVLEVQPSLERLVRESLPDVEVIAYGQSIPDHDAQVPLLSLPLILGTRLGSIPADVPYLSADPERVRAWAERLGPPGGMRRVGLVWAGNREHKNDRRRSLEPDLLRPLAELPSIEWLRVQPGATPRPPLEMVDRTAELADFADTAALLMQLDLVISVDTSVAHLAGALGRPVWIMLPYEPDWRWLLERTESPWYPTARLFRQARPGDWSSVVGELAQELAT